MNDAVQEALAREAEGAGAGVAAAGTPGAAGVMTRTRAVEAAALAAEATFYSRRKAAAEKAAGGVHARWRERMRARGGGLMALARQPLMASLLARCRVVDTRDDVEWRLLTMLDGVQGSEHRQVGEGEFPRTPQIVTQLDVLTVGAMIRVKPGVTDDVSDVERVRGEVALMWTSRGAAAGSVHDVFEAMSSVGVAVGDDAKTQEASVRKMIEQLPMRVTRTRGADSPLSFEHKLFQDVEVAKALFAAPVETLRRLHGGGQYVGTMDAVMRLLRERHDVARVDERRVFVDVCLGAIERADGGGGGAAGGGSFGGGGGLSVGRWNGGSDECVGAREWRCCRG